MKIINTDEEAAALAFAQKAAEHMAKEPRMWTFTDGEVVGGALLAIRWGLGEDCVAVVRLAHDFEPRIYPQLIRFASDDIPF